VLVQLVVSFCCTSGTARPLPVFFVWRGGKVRMYVLYRVPYSVAYRRMDRQIDRGDIKQVVYGRDALRLLKTELAVVTVGRGVV